MCEFIVGFRPLLEMALVQRFGIETAEEAVVHNSPGRGEQGIIDDIRAASKMCGDRLVPWNVTAPLRSLLWCNGCSRSGAMVVHVKERDDGTGDVNCKFAIANAR